MAALVMIRGKEVGTSCIMTTIQGSCLIFHCIISIQQGTLVPQIFYTMFVDFMHIQINGIQSYYENIFPLLS